MLSNREDLHSQLADGEKESKLALQFLLRNNTFGDGLLPLTLRKFEFHAGHEIMILPWSVASCHKYPWQCV